MTTKFTPLEIEIILDRPEECIVECSCQFYTDEMVAKYGDYNKTENYNNIFDKFNDKEKSFYEFHERRIREDIEREGDLDKLYEGIE